jgi:neuronal guanine nucleotide exchange factor
MVELLTSGSTVIEVSDDPADFDPYHLSHGYYGAADDHSYSDVYDHHQSQERRNIGNLYLRLRVICSNIIDGKWKPEEEQEVSVFVKEFGYEHEDDLNKPLPKLPGSSTYASSNSSDSFYSEPIYGITNHITNTASNRRTSPKPPPVPDSSRRPSLPSCMSQSVISCNNVIRTEPAVPLPPFNKQHSTPCLGPTSDNSLIYADTTKNLDSSFKANDKLPPVPPSKLSIMAKTAGRKIAKKFIGIRKLSRGSLDCGEPLSLPNLSNANASGSSPVYGTSSSSSSSLNGSRGSVAVNKTHVKPVPAPVQPQSGLRRPISRPSIPPPEPPKNSDGRGGNSEGSNNSNYDIYNKSNSSRGHENEDEDFDDSDFYDSDSELIRNFVSQVQPIYSMEEEPLYQYYAYGISIKPEDDYQPVIPKNLGLTLDMLVPRVGQRTLWCELSEVIASGILSILSDKQKELQEAIFEILTSEVSYLKSLDVLIGVFYKNKELIGVLNEEEKGYLFGNVEKVRDCAHSFLTELLGKWEESWYIQEIGDIINQNAISKFSVYKEYCRNKPYQDKVIQRLRHTRDEFVNILKTLEEDPRCQMLRMDSFLMLPMQRITRLPLLVNAVLQRTSSAKEKAKCEEALKSLTNLVLECNEAARESQDAEETSSILDKLEFRNIPNKPISSFGQFVMKGDFMKNPFDQGRSGTQINWTFRKNKRTIYWVLLFSNQLFVTKRKTNGKFEVLDQAPPEDANIKPLPNLEGVANDFQSFFMLHFDKKETVYFLAARTTSEIERWKNKLEAMKQSRKLLRVESIFPYEARRPDELSFGVGDLIDVGQMQPDGWYFGTLGHGGCSGWFPGYYCCEL